MIDFDFEMHWTLDQVCGIVVTVKQLWEGREISISGSLDVSYAFDEVCHKGLEREQRSYTLESTEIVKHIRKTIFSLKLDEHYRPYNLMSVYLMVAYLNQFYT